MTEKKEKPAAEAKAPKKAAAAKSAPKVEAAKVETKVAAPKAAPKKEIAEKKVPAKSGATITVEQIGSPIGRQDYQRATLIGLGLNKMHRRRTLIDTPSIRGMIERVKHLVKVVE